MSEFSFRNSFPCWWCLIFRRVENVVFDFFFLIWFWYEVNQCMCIYCSLDVFVNSMLVFNDLSIVVWITYLSFGFWVCCFRPHCQSFGIISILKIIPNWKCILLRILFSENDCLATFLKNCFQLAESVDWCLLTFLNWNNFVKYLYIHIVDKK